MRFTFVWITTFLLLCSISACMDGNIQTSEASESAQIPSLVCTPGEVEIVCKDRVEATRIALTEVPTVPGFSTNALTSEANYATSIATNLTATVTVDVPTPTPYGFIMTTTVDASSMISFLARSSYQENPHFTVTFDSKLWQLQETDLVNRENAECIFSLVGQGQESTESPTITNSEITDFQVEIRSFAQTGSVSYGLTGPDNSYFLFGLHFPIDATEQEKSECQQKAEVVLSTFHLVE